MRVIELHQKDLLKQILADNIDEKLEEIKHQYLRYKQQIINTYQSSKVIFLECPYQSLIIWNFTKNDPSPGVFQKDQKTLECYIAKLNKIIKEINGNQTVLRLVQDFEFSINI